VALCTTHGTYSTCVYRLVVWRRAHFRVSTFRPGGRRCPTFLQVPAWRGDVVRGCMPRATRVFSKETPHPAAINRSIDCPLYPGLLFFTLMRLTWLVFVERLLGGLGEGKKKVRNRDTGLGMIEKSLRIYIFLRKDGTLQQAKSKSSKQIVHDTSPRGLRVAVGQQMTEQKKR
jgi:hypothetical protein